MNVKNLILILLALAVTFSLGLAGCSKEPTTQEIIDKSVAANSKLEFYKLDMDMVMALTGTVNGKTENVSVKIDSQASVDNNQKKMQMTMNIETEVPGQGKISMPMESYLVDSWMYMKISIPMLGGQWMKIKADQSSWNNQSQANQFAEMLKNSINVTSKGTETINGKACFVLEANPDTASIANWLKSQQGLSNLQGMDMSGFDFSKVIKNMSLKEWIFKDNYYFAKTEVSVVFDISGQDIGMTSAGSEHISMNLNSTINFSEYNQKITITLPPEALAAKETKTP
jgi:hypothetical protein